MPDPQFVRVRVKATKAHITIAARAFDEHLHALLKQNPLDRNGNPRPPKYPVPSDEASPDDAEGEAAADRLVASARRGLLGLPRAALMRRLVRVTRSLLPVREHPKYFLVRTIDLVRAAVLDAAVSRDINMRVLSSSVRRLTVSEAKNISSFFVRSAGSTSRAKGANIGVQNGVCGFPSPPSE